MFSRRQLTIGFMPHTIKDSTVPPSFLPWNKIYINVQHLTPQSLHCIFNPSVEETDSLSQSKAFFASFWLQDMQRDQLQLLSSAKRTTFAVGQFEHKCDRESLFALCLFRVDDDELRAHFARRSLERRGDPCPYLDRRSKAEWNLFRDGRRCWLCLGAFCRGRLEQTVILDLQLEGAIWVNWGRENEKRVVSPSKGKGQWIPTNDDQSMVARAVGSASGFLVDWQTDTPGFNYPRRAKGQYFYDVHEIIMF